MKKNSPLKQFNFSTSSPKGSGLWKGMPTAESITNPLEYHEEFVINTETGQYERKDKDWYFTAEDVGTVPKYKKLSREKVERAYKILLSKGYTREEITQALGLKTQENYNNYQGRIKAYNDRVEKYQTSEKNLLDHQMSFYSPDDYSEEDLQTIQAQFVENRTQTGEFGESYVKGFTLDSSFKGANYYENEALKEFIADELDLSDHEKQYKQTFTLDQINKIRDKINSDGEYKYSIAGGSFKIPLENFGELFENNISGDLVLQKDLDAQISKENSRESIKSLQHNAFSDGRSESELTSTFNNQFGDTENKYGGTFKMVYTNNDGRDLCKIYCYDAEGNVVDILKNVQAQAGTYKSGYRSSASKEVRRIRDWMNSHYESYNLVGDDMRFVEDEVSKGETIALGLFAGDQEGKFERQYFTIAGSGEKIYPREMMHMIRTEVEEKGEDFGNYMLNPENYDGGVQNVGDPNYLKRVREITGYDPEDRYGVLMAYSGESRHGEHAAIHEHYDDGTRNINSRHIGEGNVEDISAMYDGTAYTHVSIHKTASQMPGDKDVTAVFADGTMSDNLDLGGSMHTARSKKRFKLVKNFTREINEYGLDWTEGEKNKAAVCPNDERILKTYRMPEGNLSAAERTAEGFNETYGDVGYKMEESDGHMVIKKDGKVIGKVANGGADWSRDGKKGGNTVGQNIGYGTPTWYSNITKIMWDNLTDDEVNKIRTVNTEKKLEQQRIIKEKVDKSISDIDFDLEYSGGTMVDDLKSIVKQNGLSLEGISLYTNYFKDETKSEPVTNLKTGTLTFINERVSSWKQDRHDKRLNIQNLINLMPSEEDKKIIREAFNDTDHFETAKSNLTNAQIERKNAIYSEKYLADNGTTSMTIGNNFAQLNSIKKANLLKQESIVSFNEYLEGTDNIVGKKEVDNLFTVLAKEMEESGYFVDINDSGNFVVSEGDLQKEYQYRLNKIEGLYDEIEGNYTETNERQQEEYSKLIKENQEIGQLTKLLGKEYDATSEMLKRVGMGFVDMASSFPALLGSSNARGRLKSLERRRDLGYRTKLTWREARETGQTGRYVVGTLADQTANITTAVVTMGLGSSLGVANGLSRTAALSRASWGTSAIFGSSSAGRKNYELTTMQQIAQRALNELDYLETQKDILDPEQYEAQKAHLHEVIAANYLTDGQRRGSVFTTGLIEGTVTRFFGTIPNTSRILGLGIPKTASNLFRGNWSAAASGIWTATKGTASEVLEESLIEYGTMLSDMGWLDRDYDTSMLTDVAMASIITGGAMNGPTTAYSTIMQQVANAPFRKEGGKILQNIENIKDKLKKLGKNDKVTANELHAELATEMKKLDYLRNGLELDARMLGGKKLQRLISQQRILDSLDVEAGVEAWMTEDQKEAKREKYKKGLNTVELEAWQTKRDTALEIKEKLTSNIDYSNAIEKLFGRQGLEIAEKLKDNPQFKNSDARGKAIMVSQEIYKGIANDKIKRLKNDPNLKTQVEREVYKDKDGNGITKAEWLEQNNRKRVSSELAKMERQMYNFYGDYFIGISNNAKIVTSDQYKNAKSILGDDRASDINIVGVEDTKELTAKEQMEKAIEENNQLDNVQKREIKETLAKGIARGVMLPTDDGGMTYLAFDKDAAQKALDMGDLLSSTVIAHEVSHIMDLKAFKGKTEAETIKNISRYAELLEGYVSENLEGVDFQAKNRLVGLGPKDRAYYDPTKTFEDQTDTAKDEYTKSVQDILMASLTNKVGGFATVPPDVKKAMNVSQRFANRFRGMIGKRGKFNLKTSQDAMYYMASFIKAFNEGKISKVAGRLIHAEAGVKVSRPAFSKAKAESENLLKLSDRERLVKTVNDAYSRIEQLTEDLSKEKDSIQRRVIESEIAKQKGIIVESYRGMAEARFDANLKTAPSEANVRNLLDNKEDIINDMLYDPGTEDAKSRSVYGMIEDFDKERQKYGNLAAYINTLFKRRSYEVFARYDNNFETRLDESNRQLEAVESEFDVDVEGKDISTSKIVLSEKIAENDPNEMVSTKAQEHNDNIVSQIESDPSLYQGKNYKQVKDLDVRSTVEMMVGDPTAVYIDDDAPFWKTAKGKKLLGTPIVDSIIKKLNNNDNLNAQDIKALQRFIRRHTVFNGHILYKSLPQGFMTTMVKQKDGTEISRPDKATGVQNVLLEHFYNRSSKRVGNGYPQYKKPVNTVSENDFLNVFGITPRGEVNIVGREQNVSQTVKALVSQVGKTMTNQHIRKHLETKGTDLDQTRLELENGMSEVLYSKAAAGVITDIPNIKELVQDFYHRVELYFNWSNFAPDMDYQRSKIYGELNLNKKIIEQQLLEMMEQSGVPKEIRADLLKELYGQTGILINIASMKTNRNGIDITSEQEAENKKIAEVLVGRISEQLEDRTVQEALKSDKKNSELHSDVDVINTNRQDITKQVQEYALSIGITPTLDGWNKATVEQKTQVAQFILTLRGQHGVSGAIGTRSLSVLEAGKMAFKIAKEKLSKVSANRKQITEGTDDLMALANNAIPGVEIIPMIDKTGKDATRSYNGITRQTQKINYDKLLELYPGVKRNKDYSPETSKSVKEELTQDENGNWYVTDINQRKEQGSYFRENLKFQFKHVTNRSLNENDSWGKYNNQVWLAGLSSDMTSVSRRAAILWGANIPELLKSTNPGKDLEYDHAKPNNTLMLEMARLQNLVLDGTITMDQAMSELDVFFEDYHVNVIDKKMDTAIKRAGYQSYLDGNYKPGDPIFGYGWSSRIFHDAVKWDPALRPIRALDPENMGIVIGIDSVRPEYAKMSVAEQNNWNKVQKAVLTAQQPLYSKSSKGITVLDFDDTLATSKSMVLFTSPDGTKGKLNAEEFAKQGADLLAEGYEFDFSEFSKVVEGKTAPLFNKALKLQKKFGPENMFILTARPIDSAPAIFEFIKANGLNIPLENITGLANSTPEAKALWIADKVAEGYNDFYFADDALQNVQAVQNMLDQFDVKSKVQQAKVKFSKSIDPTFNNILDNNANTELDINRILEQTTGVKAEAVFSEAQAKIRGSKKGKWKFWVPPSAEDFKGLIYRFVGKGRQGEQQMAFFKKALFDPFNRGYSAINNSKQQLESQYRTLLKNNKEIKKQLKDNVPNSNFTIDQAIRVYLWNKNGMEVPGLSQRDLSTLVNFVKSNNNLKSFADNLSLITNQEQGYVQPNEYWTVETIESDIHKINNELSRADHLQEFIQNRETMFGVWENGRLVGPNINKIEAIYGTRFREALEDILWRMEFGSRRDKGSNRLVNAFNNWANQSVGAIMFFNMRSALLQTISSINYINWSDNNPLKAGAALLNFPQFIKDFTMIFNSDMLKQRRAGNQRGINEAELAQAVGGVGVTNRVKAMLHYLLTKGFLPTQIADSFAISSGGATFYRNRVNTYLKQGMSQQEAEAKAFQDFQENTEESQQSSRPDMISQQQASPLGRYILAFKNTPMQYARLTKKAFLDLKHGRGDVKTNVSKIIYYMAVQNLIFTALQSALGSLIGDDDDEDKETHKRIANSMIDNVLGGLGFGGNAVMTIKNTILEYLKQEEKGWNADHTYTILKFFSLSPTIGSKGRKLYSAIQTEKFNKDVIAEMSMLDIDNPRYSSIANVISATTNIPLDRLVKKVDNVDAALTENITALERMALLMGWNTWDLDIDDSDILEIEERIKEKKEEKKKEKKKIKKKEEKEKTQEENKEKEEDNRKKKDGQCVAISRSGNRCKNKAISGGYCTIHAKVEQGTVERQCSQIKSNGERCKMKTKAKSGKCYYHD